MSRFLPENFDESRPIAVIAGKNQYPALVVERLRERGIPARLIAFDGETQPELYASFPDNERTTIKIGQLGHMLKAIEKFKAGYAMMVGQITPKRLFKGLHPDVKAVTILAKLKERNAETIFGAIASEIEKIGVTQLDARAFLDDQLAEPGNMTGKGKAPEPEALEHGIRIAKEVARLDIGQGVVVSEGTVIAVEAFEGTDAMLRRAGEMESRAPIFVKTVKPAQDYRFDVPVFGMTTLETMQAAGIKHAALEAGNVLVLDKERVLAEARRSKITLWGYEV